MEWEGTSENNRFEIDLYYCGSYCMEVRLHLVRATEYTRSVSLCGSLSMYHLTIRNPEYNRSSLHDDFDVDTKIP